MADEGGQRLKLPAPGTPAPRFHAASNVNDRFAFDTIAGRYVVLAFVGSAGAPHAKPALEAVAASRRLFDDQNISLFWVSVDPTDRETKRLDDDIPGIRVFWDFDAAVAKAYGVCQVDGAQARISPMFFLLDPLLRVMTVVPMTQADAFLRHLAALPPAGLHAGVSIPAPVLVLPRVFEPDLCRRLIQYYRDGEPEDSGFMRQVEGKTVLMKDYAHKRRRDVTITDEALLSATRGRLHARLAPEIERAFQFKATRVERYIVACYEAADNAHFKAHRDNTTLGTAHRKFAVTINLNAEDYEGGDLIFPEFGPQTYRAPTGGAVVFSCGLLHEVKPMTRGERFAFLPFLYDEDGARIREENIGSVEGVNISYKA